ncbi:Hypothetical predicted protein [Paramuricea clavata]|uniref:Uncharacterized protein n=1 Tax=Paramuricea clavata TaxID=317549 RepID=A0A7D9D8N1_PARCT|nr:Hypothetical predicted protein [Paramuricea clavata]
MKCTAARGGTTSEEPVEEHDSGNENELAHEGNDYKLLIKKQNMLEKKVKLLTHDTKQKENGTLNQTDQEAPTTPSTDMNMSTPISTPNCEKETPTGTNNSTSPTTPIPSTEEQPLTIHYTIPISNMFNPLDNDCEENGKPTTKKTVTAETIILCDSNGKHLDPKLLCSGSPTQYIRCPTVNGATKILDEYEFTSPQTFVIHSGTNDIETTNCKEVCDKLTTLTKYITTKYPNCRILLSSLLPRSDHLLQRVQLLNSEIEKIKIQSPNIIHVKHHNLFRSTNILYDKKHLNQKGVKLFAKNLKGAFFARKKNKTKQQHAHSNLYNYHYPGRDHHHLMPRNYPPPSFQPPTFHQPRPPTFHRPQPPTFHLPQSHQPTLGHPNKSWASVVSEPKLDSETLPARLKEIINVLHGFIQ